MTPSYNDTEYRGIQDIEHFACERDFSAFHSHREIEWLESCFISMTSKRRKISVTSKVSYIFDSPVSSPRALGSDFLNTTKLGTRFRFRTFSKTIVNRNINYVKFQQKTKISNRAFY